VNFYRSGKTKQKHFSSGNRVQEPGPRLKYDEVADILYIHFVPLYVEQWIDSLGDGITVRLNPETRAIEGLEVWHYMARIEADGVVMLSVEAGKTRVLKACQFGNS
jgi:uncharacterized protein YuzE